MISTLAIFPAYLAGVATTYFLLKTKKRKPKSTQDSCPHAWNMWKTEEIKVKNDEGNTVARNYISTRNCEICGEHQARQDYIPNSN